MTRLSRNSRLSLLGMVFMALGIVANPCSVGATAPGQQAAVAVWHRLQTAAWVSQGAQHPEHLIYVITDANCPFCHDLWLSLRPFYKQGLQVRYVLVGILAANSRSKAAAILEARRQTDALDRNENDWGQLPDDLGGGISPLTKPQAKTLKALNANEQLMRDLGAQGTPVLIYRDADGAVHVIHRVPDPAMLDEILHAATPM